MYIHQVLFQYLEEQEQIVLQEVQETGYQVRVQVHLEPLLQVKNRPPAPAFSTSMIIKSSYVQVPVPGSGNNNEGGPSRNGSSQNKDSSNIGNGAVAETGNTSGGNAQQNNTNATQQGGNQSRENSSASLKAQTSQQAGQKGNSCQQKLPQTGEASSIVIVSLGVAMIVGLGVFLEKNK